MQAALQNLRYFGSPLKRQCNKYYILVGYIILRLRQTPPNRKPLRHLSGYQRIFRRFNTLNLQ